ncbi:hypothetical protein [Empedobacter brevis]|uniref:hypothetical protein n=1 Tax=Empedobacter brevis TaxID=247 RepID=UPI0028A939C3|nr:hypothetical protein [Empedobacter brevis]
MKQFKNIVIELTGKENYKDEYNLEIISKNLDDFNLRFRDNIVLTYRAEDFLYNTSIAPSKLGDYFLKHINQILFLARNSSNRDLSFWDEYINWLVNNIDEDDTFKKWFTDYVPLGFELTEEVRDYIISKLNNLCASK